jgi:hypothetical protein
MTLEEATRAIEMRDARLVAALESLRACVDVLDKLGGYRTLPQQSVVMDAKFRLEAEGMRPRTVSTWKDRL